jgi:hypothetical protein
MATVDAEHDAGLWRLSDAPGSLEDQPIALDKRAKVTPNSRLAKRIDPAHTWKRLWDEAAKRIQEVLRPKFDACQRKLEVSTNGGERRAGSSISNFILRCYAFPVLDGR